MEHTLLIEGYSWKFVSYSICMLQFIKEHFHLIWSPTHHFSIYKICFLNQKRLFYQMAQGVIVQIISHKTSSACCNTPFRCYKQWTGSGTYNKIM